MSLPSQAESTPLRVVLSAESLRFSWPGSATPCIDIEAFRITAGESVFLHGPSGCGKSTLLSLLAGVLVADEGRVCLLGHDWSKLSGAARDRCRVAHVGYIFQQFNLLPYLSVVDNVLLPCRFSARRREQASRQRGAREEAEHLLDQMGLDRKLWQRQAMQLSVGQQQRVAAARALIGQPEVVIADEPTSALDEDRREAFLDVLLTACAENDSALVFVSHDQRIAQRFARHVLLPEINRASSATMATEE
ncbi:methionine ABC transporter ATP-binding protein [Variovorax paradoxus]|uniref:ABC transporter ATP-binding protein n=1 Tax=Variovorax TaxID=34072 RepID=UPI0006E4C43E|nr:ABC transporter ATP-binding protein [Variovorax sp. CY25R-8]KPU96244.1 methionine ABC transporter ATP-binding protein [Variovorax paradoxus]KPV08544.1 methionine ABC transporter ATP-binding protein [Variovorax paradoxus]KPV13624.1 methionine ABC transporter ATP-binding protein [Variovorax paradoxus]KPV23444.1 methionine ABC transporter ATP-binding protein [Variovorax paradoxus]KPV36466.1 methionine ABC transporter ATP-binding protein [Variovorax paradoxus]